MNYMKKVFLFFVIILFVCGCSKKIDLASKKDVEFVNIIYREENNGYACITFFEEGYTMYDCDSEPTNYFFDSENECDYSYTGDRIYFDCKYNYQDHKNDYIDIMEWNENNFVFIMDGVIKTFHSIEL